MTPLWSCALPHAFCFRCFKGGNSRLSESLGLGCSKSKTWKAMQSNIIKKNISIYYTYNHTMRSHMHTFAKVQNTNPLRISAKFESSPGTWSYKLQGQTTDSKERYAKKKTSVSAHTHMTYMQLCIYHKYVSKHTCTLQCSLTCTQLVHGKCGTC